MYRPGITSFDPVVHLAYSDARVNDYITPLFLEVRIKASKTDPYRQGVSIYLGRVVGKLCPVAANLDYMVRRGVRNGPFFIYANGSFLTRECFIAAVQAALT